MAEETSQTSKDNVQEAIAQHKEFLEERIDPDSGLLDLLLANGTLSRKEIYEIKNKSSYYIRNSQLLDYILCKHHGDRLITALRDVDQIHIANYLSANGENKPEFGGDWPLTSTEISILDINEATLVDILDVSELLVMLYSSKVINKRQLDFISSKPTYHEKSYTLLEILRRRSLRDYLQTIKCLHKSCQSHIADILEEGGVVVLLHAEHEGGFDDWKEETLDVKPGFKSQDAECQTDAHSCVPSTDVPTKSEEACQTEESVTLIDTGRTINEKSEAQHQVCAQSVLQSTATQTDLETEGLLVIKTDAECQCDINIGVNGFSQSLVEQEHAQSFTIEMLSKDFKYQEALMKCSAMLSDCLDVKHGLLDQLLSKCVLSKREQEAVEAETTESKQISKVADIISRKGPDQFKKFLEALLGTNQVHVVNLIACHADVSKIGSDFCPLGKNELHWIDRDEMNILSMDSYVDISPLLHRLLQVGCLTRKQFESIDQSFRKTRSLVDIIRRGSLASFNRFRECWKESRRNCIAEHMEPNTEFEIIKALKRLTNGSSEEENFNNLKQMELTSSQVSRELNIWIQEFALLRRERDVLKSEAYLLRKELEAVKKT